MRETPRQEPAHARVLVVDDENDICQMLCTCLQPQGHEIHAVHTRADAIAEAHRRAFDVAFLDLRPGAESGMDAIGPLLASSPWLRVVAIAPSATVDAAIEAMKRGAADVLPRPVTPSQIKLTVRKIMEAQVLQRRAAAQQQAVAGVMPSIDLMDTGSAEMREAAELAHRAADGTAAILIHGESGTGKRTVARAIHGWSPRANRPLAIASCRAPSAAMLEMEWFGTARKMPGGLVASQPGRIAYADGGTLVLEDVEQLSLATQSKLLRLIQNREYERPADFSPMKADVRIIATTSVDLAGRAAEGQFSSDLLYALQGVRIDLPPLRRRAEDVEPLANRYLAFFAKQAGRPCVGFSPVAIDALRGHSWPGNIRELRNLVERAVLVSRGEFVEPSDFPPGILNRVSCVAIGDPVPLEQVEELHIRGVLQLSPSIEAAAETLGMDSVTLWRRRKKYGI